MDSLYQLTSFGIGSQLMENVNQAKNLVVENFTSTAVDVTDVTDVTDVASTTAGAAGVMALVLLVLWIALIIGYFYVMYKAIITAIDHTKDDGILIKLIHVGFSVFQPVIYLIAYHVFLKDTSKSSDSSSSKYILSETPAL
jgi:hypothetical protein